MKENLTAVISCIVAVISLFSVILFTGLQLSRKIVDAFKIEVLRLFYSEPTASIFQWCRKTSNSDIPPIFSEIKGFFPQYLRWKYCERYFASALAEVELNLGSERYTKSINYDKSLISHRSQIFRFIESHKKECRNAMRGKDFSSVHCFVDQHYTELCNALVDNTHQED